MRPILLAPALCLAAPVLALDCPDGQRAFVHGAGETCIPSDPTRIVTLHDQNALLPLLELGVQPVGSAGLVDATGGHTFRRTQGYDTTGVELVGRIGEPDPEAVAALGPDLIVATPFDDAALFSTVAPTVVIDVHGQPLEDALLQFADLVNRRERAEELRGAFEERADAVRNELAERLRDTTVSIVTYEAESGQFYPADPTQAMGAILQALDPVRPAAEASLGDEREYRAMETLGAHEADVMFVLTFDEGGETGAMEAFTAMPLVRSLRVARAGQVFELDGTLMVGAAWEKAMNGLDQIAAVLGRDDLNRDLVAE